MRKIKSLFKRNYSTGIVYNEVVEDCEWVQNGEGIATRKWDGACCKIENGSLFKRYDRKLTKAVFAKKKKGFIGPYSLTDFKPSPEGWEAAQNYDPITGHWPGWMSVGDGPEDQYFREAFAVVFAGGSGDGTYELVGPKINGNKEEFEYHVLIRHGYMEYPDAPTDFHSLYQWLGENKIEGIVWHHPDGRMCKVKRSDFGWSW